MICQQDGMVAKFSSNTITTIIKVNKRGKFCSNIDATLNFNLTIMCLKIAALQRELSQLRDEWHKNIE